MNPVNIIGYSAALLSTIAFLPQAIKVLKTRKTSDISLNMYIILVMALTTWTVFGVLTRQWHIFLANAVSLVFTVPVLYLKLKYK